MPMMMDFSGRTGLRKPSYIKAPKPTKRNPRVAPRYYPKEKKFSDQAHQSTVEATILNANQTRS